MADVWALIVIAALAAMVAVAARGLERL
jgi:hypothetical protein